MKKLDKLILKSFLGPFFLTFIVVVFILLMQYMLKYFDELVGKGLTAGVYAELLFFFSINMTTMALPLAVLLSSLMTFGNLGEHFELTAIKGSGISLTRTLVPLLVFSLGLTVLAFINNDQIVPKANLNAYSLLYDIRQTKPSLSLQEGAFYNGIPNLSIKINKKFDDEVSIKDVIIYDHRNSNGNTQVTLADSGRMYTKYDDQYLILELFDGQTYKESAPERNSVKKDKPADFVRQKFKKNVMALSLESFKMNPTDQEYFMGSQVVKNISQLTTEIDSMENEIAKSKYTIFENAGINNSFAILSKVDIPEELVEKVYILDSTANAKELALLDTADVVAASRYSPSSSRAYSRIMDQRKRDQLKKDGSAAAMHELKSGSDKQADVPFTEADTAVLAKVDLKYRNDHKAMDEMYKTAIGQARYMRNSYEVNATRAEDVQRNLYKWEIEVHKKYAQAVACLVMFMIGAPLGSIIKRGGLGVPVIISIGFFIIYYVFTMFGEKWAREGMVSPAMGIWSANLILLPFGLLFLWQARNDARLFESDFYSVLIARFRNSLGEKVRKPALLRRFSS